MNLERILANFRCAQVLAVLFVNIAAWTPSLSLAADAVTSGAASSGGSSGFPVNGGLLELGEVDQGPCSPLDPNFRTADCSCPAADNAECCSAQPAFCSWPANFAVVFGKKKFGGAQKGGEKKAACCTAYGYDAACNNVTSGGANPNGTVAAPSVSNGSAVTTD